MPTEGDKAAFSLHVAQGCGREGVRVCLFCEGQVRWYVSLILPLPPLPPSPPLSLAHLFRIPHISSVLTSFAVMVERLAAVITGYSALLRAFVMRQDLHNSLRVLGAMRTRNVSVASDYGVYNLVLLFAIQQKIVDECMEVLSYSTDTVTSGGLDIIR